MRRIPAWTLGLAWIAVSVSGCGGPEPDPEATFGEAHTWFAEIAVAAPGGAAVTADQTAEAAAAIEVRLAQGSLADAVAFPGDEPGRVLVGFTAEPTDEALSLLEAPFAIEFRVVAAQGFTGDAQPTREPVAADATLAGVDLDAEWDAALADWESLDCGGVGDAGATFGQPDEFLVACAAEGGYKYVLGSVAGDGSTLAGVSVEKPDVPEGAPAYPELALIFTDEGAAWFEDLTRDLAAAEASLAIVVDGRVQSAPRIASAIAGGEARISGAFGTADLAELAAVVAASAARYELSIVEVAPRA